MGAGHSHTLYVHEHTAVHHLAPEAKLLAGFLFVVAVALTPRQAIWAFGLYALIVGSVMAVARIPIRFALTRMAAVLPFIAFAFLIPFIAGGEKVEVLGILVSREGLWGAWNVIAKASIGISVSVTLAATTEVPEIVRGLGRLRVPGPFVAIASFMVRYIEIIAAELGRMRIAMAARAYAPRWLWQSKPVATSAGALFIRSYERGERVHQAMLARGYTGSMPDLGAARATRGEWVKVSAPVVLAAAIAVTAGIVV